MTTATAKPSKWRVSWQGLAGFGFGVWKEIRLVGSGGISRDPATGAMQKLPPRDVVTHGPGFRFGPVEVFRAPTQDA